MFSVDTHILLGHMLIMIEKDDFSMTLWILLYNFKKFESKC